MKIGIVILNYLAYDDTINCADAFLNQDYKDNDYHIAIVDNNSPNESFCILSKKYNNYPRVSVMQCEKNLGFANGNNAGYREIRKFFEPDFLIVSNNDVILKMNGLIRWVIDQYKLTTFAVMGPSIYSIKGNYYQNPLPDYTHNFYLVIKKIAIEFVNIGRRIKLIGRMLENYNKQLNEEERLAKKTGVVLHGSFLVFSQKYLSVYKEPFYPGTFMYHEEFFIKRRCDIKGLITLYSPEYEVDHLQAVSTRMTTKNDFIRRFRRMKYEAYSLIVYFKSLISNDI